jgi:hypothetical protein
MEVDLITRGDLEKFWLQLLADIRELLAEVRKTNSYAKKRSRIAI